MVINRDYINITELKGTKAECECGNNMEIYNYYSQYFGHCPICGRKTKVYHSIFAVQNEQHKRVKKSKKVLH